MKLRVFALILALSFVVWAQGNQAPAAPNSTPAPEAKSCSHHMDNMKEGEGCCHHAQPEGKDPMACCDKEKSAKKEPSFVGKGKTREACREKCQKEGKGSGGSATDKGAMNCGGNSCSRHQHPSAGS